MVSRSSVHMRQPVVDRRICREENHSNAQSAALHRSSVSSLMIDIARWHWRKEEKRMNRGKALSVL